jgi:glycosyltransferase involved in cell wall biosynthesis
MNDELGIAVLIPCYNESAAIGSVIKSFKEQLPVAKIYVYDNNSTDGTAEIAEQAGAIVRKEPQQGKGHVVRRMFSDIDASVYVLVDGDDTYDAASAPKLIKALIDNHCDMVNAQRINESEKAYRFGHQFGNQLLTGMVGWIFGKRSFDMLSGYRVFSRRFVKSFPALSTGFEIETELTVHALSLHLPIVDVATPYKERPEDSVSKLNTYRDGFRILWKIILMTKEEKPFLFFSVGSIVLAGLSIILATPIIIEWLETGLVPRIPTAVLSASTMLLAFLSFTTGLILHSVSQGRREMKRLSYLNVSWMGEEHQHISTLSKRD